MPVYQLPINSLRHHDFAGRLDELYESAPGHRMSISIEHDNQLETDAVIVYWGRQWVGYVRSGKERELAYSILRQSGRDTLLGKIVGIDRDERLLLMEIDTDYHVTVIHEQKKHVLSDWSFDGETLRNDEAVTRLYAMLSNLEMVLECQEPWDEDIEEWLQYVEENLWRDISLETTEKVRHILEMLTTNDNKDYAHAGARLQYTIDYMGSPEVRQKQARQIIEKSKSAEMGILLQKYGDRAKDAIRQLPEELVTLFMNDGETFMGRLWYLHCPFKQVRAITTLLSMMIRLKDDNGEKASDAIPTAWIMQWAKESGNQHSASVVKDMLKDFELEKLNPALLSDLRNITATEDEKALADENFDDDLVAGLMPIFMNNRQEVKQFIRDVDGAKSTSVVEAVNRLLREGKITKAGCKGDMWTVMHKFKLYKPGQKNWNAQVNA